MKKLLLLLLFPLILTAQKVPENHIWADTTAYLYLGVDYNGESKWMRGDSLLGVGGGSSLTQEEVEDFAFDPTRHGTGTQTLIGVTYDDANNNVDYIVENDLSLFDNTTSNFSTGAHTGLWSQNGVDIYYNTGFAALGTSSPNYRMHLYENSTSNKFPLMLENNSSGNIFMVYQNSTRSFSQGIHTNGLEIYDNTTSQRVHYINSGGTVFFSTYDNTIDNTALAEPDNVLYVSYNGQIMVKPEPISFTTMQQSAATQEWNNTTWTTLDLETQVQDEGPATSGSTTLDRITVNATGSYTITAMLNATSTCTDCALNVDLFISGSQMGVSQTIHISGANSIDEGSATISYTRRLSVGQYIQVKTKRLGSNATSMKSAPSHNPTLTVTRIRITN